MVIYVSSLFAAYGITSDGLVVLLVLPLCVALSIAIGWIFYMLVERHFVNQPVAN